MKKLLIIIAIVLIIAIVGVVSFIFIKSNVTTEPNNVEHLNAIDENKTEKENENEVSYDGLEKINGMEEKEEKEPAYIPKGFSHKSGTIEDGYVIVDQYGNEFVWVPVESGIMTRKNSAKENYEDNDSKTKALINSVASYYGFYIARYEASKADFDGKIVATSFNGVEPWYNASFSEAKETSESFCYDFGYEDIKSGLISSYAWDSTLAWLNEAKKSYSTSLDYGNYTDAINNTGSTKKDCINNIFDMAGNLKEWTTEICKEEKKKDENVESTETVTVSLRVLRGGCVNLSKPANSQISFDEDVTNPSWGFRFVLYK